MPSLHSAYPLIVLYYAFKINVNNFLKIALSIVAVGIWFAAVYTSHHYVLDVIAGIVCTIIGIIIFKKVLLTAVWFQRFINRFFLTIV